jgi:hypothetical protein
MVLGDIREKLLKIAESVKELQFFKGIKSFFDNLLGAIPENKRVPVLAAGGGCIFVIICLIAIAASGNRSGGRVPGEGEGALAVSGPHIPAEDLYYPVEPDFLPGLLREREPRQGWTADDLRPFWRDPLESTDVWLEKTGEVIDKLMENVP